MGQSDRAQFSPAGRDTALWTRRGPQLQSKIVKDASELWKNINKALGRNFTLDEIDAMLLGAAPSAQTRSFVPSERDFSGLLG